MALAGVTIGSSQPAIAPNLWHPSPGTATGDSVVLRAQTGEALVFDAANWHAPATAEECDLLAAIDGPVIDIGCGPGRLVARLAAQGVAALGIELSPAAVTLARRQGATVVEGDVFGSVPNEGRWATVLVFDGNVGIGGDPIRLLARCRQLTMAHGQVLVEVEPPGTPWRRLSAWLERDGQRSDRFPWAVVGADAIEALGGLAGLRVKSMTETPSGRWFAHLGRSGPVNPPVAGPAPAGTQP